MNDEQPEELLDPEKGPTDQEAPEDGDAAGTGSPADQPEDDSPKKGKFPGPRFPTASDSPLLEMSGGRPSFPESFDEEELRYSRASPYNLY